METAYSINRKASPKQFLSLEKTLRGGICRDLSKDNCKDCPRDDHTGANTVYSGYNLSVILENVLIRTHDLKDSLHIVVDIMKLVKRGRQWKFSILVTSCWHILKLPKT